MKIKKFVVGVAIVALALGVAVSAGAQSNMSVAELQKLIADLTAQIAALQGGSSSAPAASFTRDLTIGSQGADVTALQTWLEGRGYLVMPVGVAKGYFGSLTKSAVMKYQAAVGLPATGYFGPLTRAQVAATAGSGTGTGTGTGTGSTGSSDLEGGAGSISSFDEVSGLSNEHVGEGEEDVEIAGLEVEVDDGSDIEITAVRLDFATQPSNDDLDEYITEVSIWLDGEEFARVDADEFNDDNSWTRTVTLDEGAIIRADDTGELVVKVSGVNNVDSNDVGDDWGLDFISVRYEDAQGASITDTTSTTEFTWDVESFATATGVELKAKVSSDSPEEGVVLADDTDDTDGVELLVFTLEAEGSDILVKDLPITLATSSGSATTDIDGIVNTLRLIIDGEEYEESVSTSGITSSITFDDIDFTIDEGDTVEVVVEADVNNIDGSTFTTGDKVVASFTASNRASVDAEDETGEELVDADKTGTANGEAQEFRTAGVMLTFVNSSTASSPTDGASNDLATFTLRFKVEAVGDTVYVASLVDAAATASVTAGKTTVAVDRAGTATTGGVTVTLVNETDTNLNSAGLWQIDEGESHTLVVTGTAQLPSAGAAGQYRMGLNGISWTTTSTDSSPDNAYSSNLDAFKTSYLGVN